MLLQIIHFPISKAPVEIQSERRVKRKQIEVESDDGETGRVDDKEKQDLRFKKPRLQKALERTTTDEADDNVLEEDDKVEKDKEEINSDNGLGGASKKEEATEENDVVPGGPDKAGEGDQIVREVEQPDNLVQLASNTDEDDEDEEGGEDDEDEEGGLDQPQPVEEGIEQPVNIKQLDSNKDEDVEEVARGKMTKMRRRGKMTRMRRVASTSLSLMRGRLTDLNKKEVENEEFEDLVDVEVGKDQPDMKQKEVEDEDNVEDQIGVEVGNDQLDNEQPGNDQPDVLEQADLNKKEVENEEFEGENKEAVLDQPDMNKPDIKKPDSNEEEIEHDSAATDHVGKPVEGDQDIQALPSSSSAAEEKTFECIEVSDSDDDEEERGDDHIEDAGSELPPSKKIKVELGAVKDEPKGDSETEKQPTKETPEERAIRQRANCLRYRKNNQIKTKKQEPGVEVEELEILGGKLQNVYQDVAKIEEHYAKMILVKTKDNVFDVPKPEPEED